MKRADIGSNSKLYKQFCPKGHDKNITGRTSSRTCLKCSQESSLRLTCKKLGITVEYYSSLPKVCCLCNNTKPGGGEVVFCKDHDHKTGKFRGLLCFTCNQLLAGIDRYFTDKEWAAKVNNYLKID